MTCMNHTNEHGDPKYYVSPFGPCQDVVLTTNGDPNICPCDGCPGVLVFEGRNTMDSLSFWCCTSCSDTFVARDIG